MYQCERERRFIFNHRSKEAVGAQRSISFRRKCLQCFDRQSVVSLFREIFIYQHYNPPIALGDKPVIFDVGGNIGLFSIYAAMIFPRPEIHCFEADPTTFDVLRRNVETYVRTKITVHNVALSDNYGTTRMVVDLTNPNRCTNTIEQGMLLADTSTSSTTSIKKDRLSDYFAEVEKVDFLKIDIEGSEFPVLRDLYQTGSLKKVRSLTMEVHRHVYENGGDTSNQLSEFLQQLEEEGFTFDFFAQAARPFSLMRLNETFMIRGRKDI
jgi:FkbM family methyltransferase